VFRRRDNATQTATRENETATMSKPPTLHNQTHLRDHFIYYNLHKGCWSLKSTVSYDATQSSHFHPSVKGRVTGHADTILATCTTTKISETGRQRVIREKRKNVHAGIIGTRCLVGPQYVFVTTELTDSMTYNPYKRSDFYDRATGVAVTTATYVLLRSGGSDNPPRVYYGNQLYYAHWHGRPDSAESRGFVSCAELIGWIGENDFTGTVYCNGLAKYDCRDGHLFFYNGDDGANEPEYNRLIDALRYDGCAVARRTLSRLVGKEYKQR
jgi:hypothetical protein